MRHIINISFSISFVVVFAVCTYVFSDTIIGALFPLEVTFSQSKTLELDQCQLWTTDVRLFEEERYATSIPILMYHQIIPEKKLRKEHYEQRNNLYKTIVTTEQFEEQMRYLYVSGYTVLNATELEHFLRGAIEVPEKSIVITFDDGFKNNMYEAAPILRKYGMTALNFLITGQLTERSIRYRAGTKQYASVKDLQANCDVFDYQSHTYNFHNRTAQDVAYLNAKSPLEIEHDLTFSFRNLNKDKRHFAYPYGDYNEKVLHILQILDVSLGFTAFSDFATRNDDLLELPRIGVYPDDTLQMFIQKIQ